MDLNKTQREKTAGMLLDLAKNVVSVLVIGGFVPGSPITYIHVILGGLFSVGIYGFGMELLKGGNDNE